ncbi:MAG: hypothetical protein H8Z69_05260 [Nanohaloarchaea archaeon]|nr:hypothetical protein [Candidatus Nanohaloarchaea archaeon]
MSSEKFLEFLEVLKKDYEDKSYSCQVFNETYPGALESVDETVEPEGKIDLLFEDRYSAADKMVGATRTSMISRPLLEKRLDRKRKKNAGAALHVESVKNTKVNTELALKPEGELKTVYELYEGTQGSFEWGDAETVVSNPSNLYRMRDEYLIQVNQEVLRERDEERWELCNDLEDTVDLLRDVEVYL